MEQMSHSWLFQPKKPAIEIINVEAEGVNPSRLERIS